MRAKTAFAKFLGLDALLALRIRIRECLDEQLCELPIATSPLNLGLAKRNGGHGYSMSWSVTGEEKTTAEEVRGESGSDEEE